MVVWSAPGFVKQLSPQPKQAALCGKSDLVLFLLKRNRLGVKAPRVKKKDIYLGRSPVIEMNQWSRPCKLFFLQQRIYNIMASTLPSTNTAAN